MGGISHRKVLTARATDGKSYKQLFKANDDLRQDAMMKWVFKEVSKMLLNHKATRQRQLHVRTYGVIPLSTGSGIMEWVAKSFPMGEWLRPAAVKSYPKCMRPSDASKSTIVAANNTQSTGEGQAVPENLQADATRDAALFLRAIRQSRRVLCAKRMQDAQQMTENVGNLDEASSRMKELVGEADRALSIVEKNLSKTLSPSATINELIQQAMDENNLATLSGGWSAFF
ncbi:Serine/threonine-protein kinase tel1 [Elasticomyces elasticus]|nr:Serine/threonine-protein kinase tel1 [Elasticomyces elasticus]